MQTYLILFFAILSEVIGTIALKLSNGFTKPIPGIVVVAAMARVVLFIVAGIEDDAYSAWRAIWSAVGLAFGHCRDDGPRETLTGRGWLDRPDHCTFSSTRSPCIDPHPYFGVSPIISSASL